MNWQEFLNNNPQITVGDLAQMGNSKALEIVGTDDLEAEIDYLYANGRQTGEQTGWSTLDENYRISMGFWTLVTGWPNMGKSSWLDNLAVQTMGRHDWKWLMFSAENQPYASHWAQLAELYIGKPFDKGAAMRMSPAQRDEAKAFLKEHLWHIMPADSMTVRRILEVSLRGVEQFGVNCIVIDPWNELDHSRPVGMTETEYVSNALSQIRQFARDHKVHVYVVAHPTKLGRDKDGKLPIPTPHDVSGGAHFWNKADYAICVWRDFSDDTGETHVYVQKARFRYVARLGRISLFFDHITGRYIDRNHRPNVDELVQRQKARPGFMGSREN